MMDAETIIHDHYRPGTRLTNLLLDHSRKVRDKALLVAAQVGYLNPDRAFIAQAAMLHDIGICWTRAEAIDCRGSHPYIRHGIIGRAILTQYGLAAHGLVCERHVGAGIRAADIAAQCLPLPLRDMTPVSLEEIIVCYADTFYSKTNGGQPHSLDAVLEQLRRHGNDGLERFLGWHRLLNP